VRPAVAVAAALLVALSPGAARSQSAPAFTGSYRLTLTFGPTCTSTVRSVSILLTLSENAITGGSEVEGHPVRPDETPVAQAILHRVGTTLHGPLATLGSRADREPITSVEGYLTALWLILDGTVTSGSGRPSARGTGTGLLEAGRAEDGVSDSLGTCTAADHSWTLDPI
jgi:hypothetical protein